MMVLNLIKIERYEQVIKIKNNGRNLKESYGSVDRINQLLFDLFKNLGVDASDDIRFDDIVEKIDEVYRDSRTKVDVSKALSRLDKSFEQVPENQPNQYPFPDGTRQYEVFISDDPDMYYGYVITLMGPDWVSGESDAVYVIVDVALKGYDEYEVEKRFKYPGDLDKAVNLANNLVREITPSTTDDEFAEICYKYGINRI